MSVNSTEMIDTPMLRRDLSGLNVDEAVRIIERVTSSALDRMGTAPEIGATVMADGGSSP